jgi:hypothetical protein
MSILIQPVKTGIDTCAFSVQPVKTGYEMQIKFLDKDESLVSQKEFVFEMQQAEESKASKEEQGEELIDAFTKNGKCNSKIAKVVNNLFDKDDVAEATMVAGLLKGSKSPTMLVLDLKDQGTGYKGSPNIPKSEAAACKKLAQGALAAFTPDFVMCEGSLKVDVLKSGDFSASEIEYFHTPAGAGSFCKCAEFFMHFFKFGINAHGKKGDLLAGKYIVPITGKSYKPCTKSTVLYPKFYKDDYPLDGVIAKELKKVFGITGGYDPKTGITTWNLVKA